MPVLLDQLDDAHRIDGWIHHELHAGRFGMGIDFDDADSLGGDAQAVCFDQRLDRVGQFAKTVDQLFLHVVDFLLRAAVGQPLVDRQAFVNVAAEIGRQQGGHVQVDFGGGGERRRQVRLLACLERAHRRVKHVGIELEADFEHFTGLVLAQHFACAANF